MALITTPTANRISEGTRSAAIIGLYATRNAMPSPYLLDTHALQDDRAVLVAGDPEQRTPARKPRPLRFLKDTAPVAPLPVSFGCCGDGRCGDLGCEGHPSNNNGDHIDVDPTYRRWTARFLVLWCAGWLLASAWFAFFH